MEVRDLRLQNCDATIEQITAYKVACEFLKRDDSWKFKWGITPTNANNNGKKLITLGGMYPIVSRLIFGLFGTQFFQILTVHFFKFAKKS